MKKDNGQALVTLLVFTTITLLITTAAVVMIIVNSLAVTKFQEATSALYVAESGAENAILRLLRNPNYAGETLSVGEGWAAITVADGIGDQKIISSAGAKGNFLRRIQVTIDYAGNVLTILSWKEI